MATRVNSTKADSSVMTSMSAQQELTTVTKTLNVQIQSVVSSASAKMGTRAAVSTVLTSMNVPHRPISATKRLSVLIQMVVLTARAR